MQEGGGGACLGLQLGDVEEGHGAQLIGVPEQGPARLGERLVGEDEPLAQPARRASHPWATDN